MVTFISSIWLSLNLLDDEIGLIGNWLVRYT